MNNLEPCPFCGRTDKLIINEVRHQLDDIEIKQYQIVCSAAGDNTGCGGSCGFQRSVDEAITAWNRRARTYNGVPLRW